jgi:hypothetical protein
VLIKPKKSFHRQFCFKSYCQKFSGVTILKRGQELGKTDENDEEIVHKPRGNQGGVEGEKKGGDKADMKDK